MDDAVINIEIISADNSDFTWLCLKVKPGTTIVQAIQQSGVTIPNEIQVGIWGENKTGDYVLDVGDRIEIYQPLREDPKILRQKRAKQEALSIQNQRKMKKELRLMRLRAMDPSTSQ